MWTTIPISPRRWPCICRRSFPKGSVIRKAHSIKEAKELLQQEDFRAAVIDHELPDGLGGDLIRSLARQKGGTMALFLVSGANPDEIKVTDLLRDHPNVTFIEKPFRYDIVSKKILESVIPPDSREQSFHGLRLFDLIQAYALARQSMTIRMLMPDGKMGTLAVRDGDLIHAAVEGLEGQDALMRMAQNSRGEIRVEEGCFTSKKTIHMSTQQVLIDTIRQLDELQAFPNGRDKQPIPPANGGLSDLFDKAFEENK